MAEVCVRFLESNYAEKTARHLPQTVPVLLVSIWTSIQYGQLFTNESIFYRNHFDICTWNLLDKSDFNAAFRMALFYLELFHDQCMNHNGKA